MPRIPRPLLLAAFILPVAAYAIFWDQTKPSHSVDDDRDSTLLAHIPELIHLAASLEGESLRVMDLLRNEPLTFQSPPNPTAYFDQLRQGNLEMLPVEGSIPISVLTYNLGLLDRLKILNIIGRVRVPEIEHRRRAMAKAIIDRGFDIYLLQEVWEDVDAAQIANVAKARGYTPYKGSDAHHSEHGLLILIKNELLNESTDIQMGEYQYQSQYGLEFWPGPGIRRGLLWFSFVHPELGLIRLVDTHLSAFPGHWRVRIRQVRELALHVDGDDDALIIMGGDMNAGPFYPRDTWVKPDGSQDQEWFSNGISYGLLLYYLGAKDLFVMGADPMDVILGKRIQPNEERLLEMPLGVAGYCQETPHLAFTATDCNSLYFRNYGGTEYPARLDHLFVRDRRTQVRVKNSELVFTERMKLDGDRAFELSDHYGVVANIEVAPLGSMDP